MDELAGEKLKNLAEDVFQKREHAIIAGAIDVFVDAPSSANLIILPDATQFRVGGQSREAVTGQLDLRNDGDAPFAGICDHLANLLLRIKAAVGLAIELSPVGGQASFLAESADFVSLGYFLISIRQP